MLAAPKVQSKSNAPLVLLALAVASGGAYWFLFREKPAAAPSQAKTTEQAPAPAAKAAELAALEKAFQETVPVPAPAPAPAAAPKAAPGKPATKTSSPKKAEVAPVKFEAPAPEPAAAPAPLPAPVPPPAAPAPASPRAEVEALVAAGKWREARSKVAALFGGAISDAERTDLSAAGIKVNQELLQNRADEKDVELYEIQQGDTLEAIAKRFKAYNGVKGALMYVNNYKENAILRAGRKVRVTKGTWSILVDKSQFTMYVLYEGCPFKTYTITTGAVNKETPAAKFIVGGKNPKPSWWPSPEMGIKGPVPYGDPKNPLGEWWISLEHDLHHGIGIHGTNDPASIGTKASYGCVRMRNEEVGEVAALAYKGMVVTVVE